MATQANLDRFSLHHLGIVVADLDAATKHYESLGFESPERLEMPDQGVILVTFQAGPRSATRVPRFIR